MTSWIFLSSKKSFDSCWIAIKNILWLSKPTQIEILWGVASGHFILFIERMNAGLCKSPTWKQCNMDSKKKKPSSLGILGWRIQLQRHHWYVNTQKRRKYTIMSLVWMVPNRLSNIFLTRFSRESIHTIHRCGRIEGAEEQTIRTLEKEKTSSAREHLGLETSEEKIWWVSKTQGSFVFYSVF